MSTDYSIPPVLPLPLDSVDPKAAYKLMNRDALPTQVKELIAPVDTAVESHLVNGLAVQNGNTSVTRECEKDLFCNYHVNLISESDDARSLCDMWILQRDIAVQLFRGMMGVVRSAGDLARRHRECDPNGPSPQRLVEDIDLELAFQGDARGGFQWLNCLAKDDCDWVWASIVGDEVSLESHCPACLLGRAIDSESTIRLLLAAAKLYEWDFFVASLRQHLLSDPWWGPGHWETIAPKASILESQIRELLTQCASLRSSLHTRSRQVQSRRPDFNNAARTVSDGSALRVHKSLSPRMRIDFDALHAFLSLQLPPQVPSGRTDREVRKYEDRSSAEYRLAVYCWFALMLGISSGSPQSTLSPVVRELMWKSRVKTRSRTI